MSLIYIKGNLIDLAMDGMFDIIIHGCNCFNTMKSGIAKEIAERIPQAVYADGQTIKGDKNKLGTWTSTYYGEKFMVVNAYTQYNYGRNPDPNVIYFDYNAFDKFLVNYREFLFDTDVVGFPKIGAGLAKGDWDRISEMIDKRFTGYCDKVYIVTLE